MEENKEPLDPIPAPAKKLRGFALLTPEQRKEMGSKGGKTTIERYGRDAAVQRGRAGAAILRDEYGDEIFTYNGQQGGLANVEKNGTEHMSSIGKKGMKSRYKTNRIETVFCSGFVESKGEDNG